mmetsp:Transcript_96924/g.289544  ORF Transcript_96924/g.289544 Transcript_96924/m.289544 type:complete len:363 (-) Transcript_96924:6-1094(-)
MQGDALVAVDCKVIALEDPNLVRVLVLKEALLVAPGHHDGDAEERRGVCVGRGLRRLRHVEALPRVVRLAVGKLDRGPVLAASNLQTHVRRSLPLDLVRLVGFPVANVEGAPLTRVGVAPLEAQGVPDEALALLHAQAVLRVSCPVDPACAFQGHVPHLVGVPPSAAGEHRMAVLERDAGTHVRHAQVDALARVLGPVDRAWPPVVLVREVAPAVLAAAVEVLRAVVLNALPGRLRRAVLPLGKPLRARVDAPCLGEKEGPAGGARRCGCALRRLPQPFYGAPPADHHGRAKQQCSSSPSPGPPMRPLRRCELRAGGLRGDVVRCLLAGCQYNAKLPLAVGHGAAASAANTGSAGGWGRKMP